MCFIHGLLVCIRLFDLWCCGLCMCLFIVFDVIWCCVMFALCCYSSFYAGYILIYLIGQCCYHDVLSLMFFFFVCRISSYLVSCRIRLVYVDLIHLALCVRFSFLLFYAVSICLGLFYVGLCFYVVVVYCVYSPVIVLM